jgi:hypothetical protein
VAHLLAELFDFLQLLLLSLGHTPWTRLIAYGNRLELVVVQFPATVELSEGSYLHLTLPKRVDIAVDVGRWGFDLHNRFYNGL